MSTLVAAKYNSKQFKTTTSTSAAKKASGGVNKDSPPSGDGTTGLTGFVGSNSTADPESQIHASSNGPSATKELSTSASTTGQPPKNEALKEDPDGGAGADVKGSLASKASSTATPVTNGQISNNNNNNKIKVTSLESGNSSTSSVSTGHVSKPSANSEGLFDRKRHLIGDEFFKPGGNPAVVTEPIKRAEDLTIPTIVASAGGELIYEDDSFEQGQPGSKITEGHEISLTDEELLKRLTNSSGEHRQEPGDHPEGVDHPGDTIVTTDAPVVLYSPDGSISSSAIIDATKLGGLYGTVVTAADFAQAVSPPVTTYMASILSQNEPEDLTGNRRGSHNQDDNNDGLHLASLKLSDKSSGPVVVTTSDGPVVLTAADLTNATFQTSVSSADGVANFSTAADFATFDNAPRSIGGYAGDQYRPASATVGEIYTAPGDYPPPPRGMNSDGQFVPYQYKVEPCPTPVPNANHINSPDSGIGDPTLNASHGPPESFDNYPHADILNDIGSRKPWHQDYGRSNEEKIVIPKLPESPYGFKYILEAPTSSSVRREDDRITYVNKGQFYGITLDYVMDPEGPHIKNHTVKTIIMVVFRDGKGEEEEVKYWQFWHSRQHSVKQRILDADTKNSAGIQGHIEEIAHNALAFCWNPYEGPAKVNIAVQCLSTDFSTQKGVKGMPLHIQIDTYDDIRDPNCPVFHRAYAQVKVFCDKGAERKARDEERRANKRKMNNTGKRRIDEMYHTATDRTEFYSMADLSKPPVLFRPVTDPDKASLDFGTELPGFYNAGSRGSPPEHPAMLKMNGSNGSPSPTNTPTTLDVQPTSYNSNVTATLKVDVPFQPSILSGNGALLASGNNSGGGGPLSEPLTKRARVFPPTTERIMIYVKQETEDAFTALHVKPPTAQGLIGAIESKYKINGNSIRYLFKQNRQGHKVKIDDDMITYYSNEAVFFMQVHISEQQGPHGEDVYDITFTEI